MPTNLILALRASLRKIAAAGLDAHIAKHKRACLAVRAGLRNLGFEMFVPDAWAAATVTGVLPGKGFAANDLVQWLAAERGIFVGGGIGEMAGKIFRVGHLGKATIEGISRGSADRGGGLPGLERRRIHQGSRNFGSLVRRRRGRIAPGFPRIGAGFTEMTPSFPNMGCF